MIDSAIPVKRHHLECTSNSARQSGARDATAVYLYKGWFDGDERLGDCGLVSVVNRIGALNDACCPRKPATVAAFSGHAELRIYIIQQQCEKSIDQNCFTILLCYMLDLAVTYSACETHLAAQ